MKRQHKLIFAILFGFNVLLTVVGIVIGVSFPTIAFSISTAILSPTERLCGAAR